MAALTTVLAVSSVAIAAGGTAYSISESEKAKDEAEKQSKLQIAEANKLQTEADQQRVNESAINEREAKKIKAKTGAFGGRQSTILTDGLGSTNGGTGSGTSKTVLGS